MVGEHAPYRRDEAARAVVGKHHRAYPQLQMRRDAHSLHHERQERERSVPACVREQVARGKRAGIAAPIGMLCGAARARTGNVGQITPEKRWIGRLARGRKHFR